MPEKIRILRLVTRLNVGGPSRHIRLLMERLDPERFEQRLVVGSIAEGEIELAEATPFVRHRLPNMHRAIRPLQDWRAYRAIQEIVGEYRPDIIHSHQAKAGFLARMAGRGRAQLVHTFHGHTFAGYWDPFSGFLFRQIERYLAGQSRALVIQAPSQGEDLVRFLGPAVVEKLRLVSPGRDFVQLEPLLQQSSALRSELGLTDQRIIAFVARLAPVKNCQAFLRVVKRLVDKTTTPIVALIVGGGDRVEEERLQDLADELQIRPQLRWLGYRSDVSRILDLADVSVSTSINEGTPLGLLESLWCGTPVAAFGVGGIPDMLKGIPGGTVVEPGIEEQLALAIEEHLAAGKLSGESLVACREELRARFGPERLLKDVAQLYEDLMINR